MSAHPTSARPPLSSLRPWLKYWPLMLFIAATMILNPLLFLVMESMGSTYTQHIFFGLMFGELTLVGIVGGLFGRHWLSGYVSAILLAMAGLFVVWQVTDFRISAFRQLPWFWRCCHIPATLLVAILPMMALRWLFNWRISHCLHHRRTSRLEDVFVFTAIVACTLVLFVTPTIVSKAMRRLAGRLDYVLDSDAMIWDEIAYAGWGAFSLALVSPLIFLILDRGGRLRQRWWQTGLHAMLAVAVGLAILTWFSSSTENLPYFAASSLVAYLVVFVGLICFRGCGFSLRAVPFKVSAESPQEPSLETAGLKSEATATHAAPHTLTGLSLWLPRVATLFMIMLAGYASVAASNFQRRATEVEQEFAKLKQDFQAKQGFIDGKTFATAAVVKFGPDMDDQDLFKIRQCFFVEKMDLSNSKVSDAGMKHVSSLSLIVDLNLSNTNISDATLDILRTNLGNLERFDLSNTKVSVPGVSRFLKWIRVIDLDLSDNSFDDQQIASLEGNSRMVVKLQGNPFTAASIPALSRFRGLGLGRNQLEQGWAQQFAKIPEVLLLEGDQINDAVLSSISDKTRFVDRLQLQDAAITDSGLLFLKNVAINSLVIGGGQVTDQGLADAQLSVAYQLKLGHPFTGQCLQSWPLDSLSTIDLSYSRIDDAILSQIDFSKTVRYFGFSGTDVSDVGLKALQDRPLELLYLNNTQVSDDFIMNAKAKMVLVEKSRLEAAQISLAKERGVAVFDVEDDLRILDESRRENRTRQLANVDSNNR